MTTPNKKRRPPHHSFDPRLAHDPETLGRAVVLHRDGHYDEAWGLYVKLEADSLAAGKGHHWHALMMGALLWYQRTSKVDFDLPDDLDARFPKQFKSVIGILQEVILQKPKFADPRYNLGVILEGLGRMEEARARFQQAVDIDDAYAEAWVNLGNTELALGNPQRARECFEVAQTLRPDDPLAQYNLMHALALFGEWDEAYRRYELRYLVPGHLRDHGLPRVTPRWQGQWVNHLVVTDEQGAGDILQYVRFLPVLESYCATLSCRVRHPALIPLLRFNYPRVNFFSEKDRVPRGDAHQPLLSCVNMLQVPETEVPTPDGYLRPPPTTTTVATTPGIVWKHPTSNTTGGQSLRVGVCWAGSPSHKRDATRSIPFDAFRPVLDTEGVEFVNLTVGATAQQEHPAMTSPPLTDYSESARIVSSCDLVVTVDTSVAHLTGALGVPCWLLIASSPDFRWGLGRDDSPWYSSVRLFRQQRSGDWSPTIEAVKLQLQQMRG